MCGPRQFFFFKCGPEMPKGWTPLQQCVSDRRLRQAYGKPRGCPNCAIVRSSEEKVKLEHAIPPGAYTNCSAVTTHEKELVLPREQNHLKASFLSISPKLSLINVLISSQLGGLG